MDRDLVCSIKREVPFYLLFRSHIGPYIQLHLFEYLHYFITYITFLQNLSNYKDINNKSVLAVNLNLVITNLLRKI